jgi:formyltetrahydrofolate synthetase
MSEKFTEELKEKMNEIYPKISHVEVDSSQMHENIDELERRISELQKLKVVITNQRSEFELQNKRIWNNFDRFCQYQHLKQHRQEVDPIIKSCETMITQFKEDIKDTKQIIRRFDEVLLEKAPKFDIEILKKDIKKFLPSVDFEVYKSDQVEMSQKINRNFKEIENKFVENYDEIMVNMKEAMKNLSINIKENLGNFLKKDFVSREEFNFELRQKANSGFYDDKMKEKTDKIETAMNTKEIRFLNDQLEQSMVVLVEL